MKKTLVTTALLLATITAFAQTSSKMVFTIERTIGKMIDTQEEIKAAEYVFPERIYDSYIDTISKTVTMQLRGMNDNGRWLNRGKIALYDLTDKKIKWTKNIAYHKNSVEQFGSTIMFGGLSKHFCLNIETGKNLWKTKNRIRFVDPVTNIGVGYQLELGHQTDMLEGINLKTGKSIWQREVNRDYGWNNLFQINDSEWLIASAGLHTIDIRNGLGWSYHAATGEKDYSGTAAANAAGAALGLLTGTFMFSTGYNLLWDVVSNVHSDNTGLYLASKERIARINRDNGIVIWQNLFPADLSSKSLLFADDSLVYMINYGYASMNNRQIFYGTPFFAAYDKENGAQVFFSTINITRNPILGFKIIDDCFLFLFKDRFMKYSLSDGAQILEKTIDNNEFGELRGFVSSRVYINTENSSLTSLELSEVSKKFIISSNNKVLIIDDELNIVGDIDADQFYIANRRIGDYLFVTKDNKTFILDTDNKKVAEIDMELNPVWIGDKLYSVRENSFFEIDVANLIEQLQSVQNRRRDVMANF